MSGGLLFCGLKSGGLMSGGLKSYDRSLHIHDMRCQIHLAIDAI